MLTKIEAKPRLFFLLCTQVYLEELKSVQKNVELTLMGGSLPPLCVCLEAVGGRRDLLILVFTGTVSHLGIVP